MADANALIKQAIKAYKAKDNEKAKNLLLQAVDIDEKNEQGWLWLSAVVDSQSDKITCLENVLSLNPNNEQARKGLDILKKSTGQTGAGSTPAQPPAPAGTAATPFDTGGQSGNAWDSGASPTSADWDRSGGTPTHGSGQQVPGYSPEQLDDWVSGMNLGGDSGSSPSGATDPFASSGADPFSGSQQTDTWDSSPGTADPFAAAGQQAAWNSDGSDPFAGTSGQSAFTDVPDGGYEATGSTAAFTTDAFNGAAPSGSDPFGAMQATSDDPFGTMQSADNDPFGTVPQPDDPFSAVPQPGGVAQTFDATDDVFGLTEGLDDVDSGDEFDFEGVELTNPGALAVALKLADSVLKYYDVLPADIQKAFPRNRLEKSLMGGGGGSRGFIVATLLLLILNAVAAAGLVMAMA